MAEYRITFAIERQQDGEDDFSEIGFGCSGEWGTPEQAVHMVESAVQNFEWETSHGMPEPEDVKRDVEQWETPETTSTARDPQ